MNYTIDRQSPLPAYLQIYSRLRQDITAGIIKNGDKLPSKRTLAEEMGVSVITVEHAYALLADEGYIQSRQRSGFYASFAPGMSPAAPERSTDVKRSAAVPDTGDFPFSALAKTMRRVLSEYGSRLLIKSPGSGCPELKAAISDYLRRSRDMLIDPERIIIGSGAEYLYGLIVQLLGRDCLFALEDPCYEKIRQVYESNGASCCLLKMGSDGILSRELSACSAGVLHVTPYSSYPSGITASASKRHEYAAWAAERGSYIIEDDYNSEFSVMLRQIDTICSLCPENVIYVNTFTRTLAPSMRMGYMVLPEKLLESYRRHLDFYSCTVPVFEQYVLAEFINSGDFERSINRRRRLLRQSEKQQK